MAYLTAESFNSPRLHGNPTDAYIGMTGAQIFHSMMLDHGVECMFGYPGGAILPVFDAIFNSKHFEFILSRHEQGASHMAEGYARVTGKPGIVLVTSGPGATNTVTGMQDALMDGTPMIVFSGQVATSAIGSDAFQEADMTGIARSCTKWSYLVKRVDDLPRAINTAFKIATSGRPGPVFIDLPKDVTAAVLKNECYPEPWTPGFDTTNPATASAEQIETVAELIAKARKPVLYVGQGTIQADAIELMRELSKKAQIPVTTSLQALGAFDENDPLALHMLGMHGSAYANWAMRDADLIIALGARFDDRITGNVAEFAPAARAAEAEGRGGIVHFDIAPEQINKIVKATIGIEGDLRTSLEMLLPLVAEKKHNDWVAQIQDWKKQEPLRYTPDDREFHLKPQQVIESLDKISEGDCIVTTGVGQHQMWAAQFYTYSRKRQWFTSGGAGTMGYGVPASIGGQLAENITAKREGRKPHQVVNIDGDGSFTMTCIEMVTAAQYGINAKTILLNNDFLGMVKQWQDLFYEERYSHTEMCNPDFCKLTEAMNCKAFRCTKAADLDKIMAEFLAYDGPSVLECLVEKHEHVYPMLPAGKSVDEMVLFKD